MVAPSMIDVSELSGFPGAEGFTQEMVEVAVAAIRADAGWHIAPVVTETVTVFGDGRRSLFLPSLRVLSVDAVTFGGLPVQGWMLCPGCVLYGISSWEWPVGPVQVTLTHGYESAPDLIPAVAARLNGFTRGDRAVVSQTDGPFTTTYSTDAEMSASDTVISRYSIPAVA